MARGTALRRIAHDGVELELGLDMGRVVLALLLTLHHASKVLALSTQGGVLLELHDSGAEFDAVSEAELVRNDRSRGGLLPTCDVLVLHSVLVPGLRPQCASICDYAHCTTPLVC